MWFKEIPIKGRRISPAALVAIVIFFCTISNELISIDKAVWFETGSSKISASSVNWGRIFCVNVCSKAFVWLRTDDTRLSTFLPAVKTSSSPLCKSSFPYNPTRNMNNNNVLSQGWIDWKNQRLNLIKLDLTASGPRAEKSWRWLWAWFMKLWKNLWRLCLYEKRGETASEREYASHMEPK